MQLDSVAFSHPGVARLHNEDAYVAFPDIGVWLVADGMGGHRAGDVASRMICDTLAEARRVNESRLGKVELEQALQLANQRIWRFGQDHLRGRTLGSTVVALLLDGNEYHLFWAGDSRCYLLRSAGMTMISRDHSLVADMVEKGLLTEDEAEVHPNAHVITRALGVADSITLDYTAGKVCPGDLFLLCSDGVNKELDLGAIKACMAGRSILDSRNLLKRSLLSGECRDNITGVIVSVT